MYTGTQKKAIVLKSSENRIFEEAFFILKDDLTGVSESEMVREADKIIKNNIIGGYFYDREEKNETKDRSWGIVLFLLGALLSFFVCTVVFLTIK